MQSSFFRRTLPKFTFALVALTVGVFLSRADTTFAVGTFTATSLVDLSSTATSANANLTTHLVIPAPDYNFSNVINASPGAATVKCGPNGTTTGCSTTTPPAIGDVVGQLHSATKLGLLNAHCDGDVDVNFVFLNATTDVTDTIDPIPQAATNTGQGGTLSNQWSDDGAGAGQDAPWNAAWPGMDAGESTNGLPAQVDEYPSYINTIFTPDDGPAAGTPVQPIGRYAGAANVAGSAIMLNLVLFAPDALASAFPAPHPFHDLKGLGYTSIAVLNNPVAPAAPSDITDFCSALATDALVYGTARDNPCNGTTVAPCNTPTGISLPCLVFPTDTCTGLATTNVRYANPSVAGTYAWVSFHQSLRDTDGDGKENSLDPCPLDVDTENQRTAAAEDDTDNDGIPNECDGVANPGDTDQEDDGWRNRGDNCPTISNADNAESELPPTLYKNAAPKGGPRNDSIGDACEANDTVADGLFLSTLSYDPHCIGAADGDSDRYCDADETANGSNPANGASKPETSTRVFNMWMVHWGSGPTPPDAEPVQFCNDGVDNDLDGSTDTADSGCTALDQDGDGYSHATETHVTTNTQQACDMAGAPTQPNAFWPSDFAGTGITGSGGANRVTLADITSFTVPAATRKFGQNVGDPNYNVRWDISPANPSITLADLTTITSGQNGSPARPPFYDYLTVSAAGAAPKAFGNPVFCNDIFN